MKNKSNAKNEAWDIVIIPNQSWRDNFDLKKILKYKDLMWLLVKRDVVAIYKQTILGPIWFFIQPVFTIAVYILVFGLIAELGTDGIPMPLFYLSGVILWGYFSTMVTTTSSTFIANEPLFSKVYFPRIIVPLSLLFSNGLKFLIQFVLFLFVYLYFFSLDLVEASSYYILLPFSVILIAVQGLSVGLIISALATRFRDVNYLVKFGVDLLRYATPIIYPLSILFQGSTNIYVKYIIIVNPMTSLIDSFKVSAFGNSYIQPYFWESFAYSVITTLLLLIWGIAAFHKVEKKFIDTI